jgi:hypothetical protein
MHDRRALVLDVVEPRGLGDPSRLRRPDPELEPERPRADGDRLAGDGGAELGAAEDVDQVDRLVDLVQRAGRTGCPLSRGRAGAPG